jgi:ribosomal protein L9
VREREERKREIKRKRAKERERERKREKEKPRKHNLPGTEDDVPRRRNTLFVNFRSFEREEIVGDVAENDCNTKKKNVRIARFQH